MKESVAIAKEADTKKDFSPTKSDKIIHCVQHEPERQLGSLRSVINNISRDGGTPSVDSIATELSTMPSPAQRASTLLAMQRTHGNRYVQQVVAGIQAKLEVGQPGDIYEQEADRVADVVMRMAEPPAQRQSEDEEKKVEKSFQTKEFSGQTPEVSPKLESRIQSLRGGGQPLPELVRAFFEPRFGYDFSQVRVHTDAQAAESARAVNARAFTTSRDIVFGAGQYAPGTGEGERLLAHELTHVLQQSPAKTLGRKGTAIVEIAPVGCIMRSPFNSESPQNRTRRLRVIGSTRIAIQQLRNALSRGYIWSFEVATAGGITPAHIGVEETTANREARLRQLIADLIHMVIRLETAPIPGAWLDPEARDNSDTFDAASLPDPTWTDTVMFYAHLSVGLGRGLDLVYNNSHYISNEPIRRPAAPRTIISRGVPLGLYILVPDPENEPLVYTRLTRFERLQEGGVFEEVCQDDFGYYYLYRGEQHYLPGYRP